MSKQGRILGYDVARALAVMGMVVVNFKIVMGAGHIGPDWLVWLVSLLEGRAAATFVILAGVGISLLSQKARLQKDSIAIRQNRNVLLKRSLFLFVVGLIYTPIWPADILHFYGIYIVIGACLLTASEKRLWLSAISFAISFVVLILIFDYEANWNWTTLEYFGFWTIDGMFRHLIFNGFHPVIPWTSFLLIGMWLGRQNITEVAIRNRIMLRALIIAIGAESLSAGLIHTISPADFGMSAEDFAALLGTSPMPPMPLYLIAASGSALVLITACVGIAEKLNESRAVMLLVSTGQLALTFYVAHVIIGMGFLSAIGLLENQTLLF